MAQLGLDVAKIDIDEFGVETPEFALKGTSPQIHAWIASGFRAGTVLTLELWFTRTDNSPNLGAMEFRALNDAIGVPKRIMYHRPPLIQRVFLDYEDEGVLLIFTTEDQGEVCLPRETGRRVVAIMYSPDQREAIADSELQFAADWPSSIGQSKEQLWQALQMPSECIPPAY